MAALFAFLRGLGSFPKFTITPSPHPEHSARGKHLYKTPEELARSEMEGGESVCPSAPLPPSCVCSLRGFCLLATPWTICSPPVTSVHGIFQARTLEWVMPFPPLGDLPGIEPASLTSPASAGEFFTTAATWAAPYKRLQTFKGTACLAPT